MKINILNKIISKINNSIKGKTIEKNNILVEIGDKVLINNVIELKKTISKLDNTAKKNLIGDKKINKINIYRIFYFPIISNKLKLIADKNNFNLSKKLNFVIDLFERKEYTFSKIFDLKEGDLFDYYIECFFSKQFIKILVENGISKLEIEEGYYEIEDKTFNSKKIEKLYNENKKVENLLIYYITLNGDCGGRSLLILNGPHKNMIAYDNNYQSFKKYLWKNIDYQYPSYLFSSKTYTIFDAVKNEIKSIKYQIEK
jgi:hypothetical protein